MSPELQTIHQIRSALDLILANQGNTAAKSLLALLDRLLDEHFARLGVTDEQLAAFDELAAAGDPN